MKKVHIKTKKKVPFLRAVFAVLSFLIITAIILEAGVFVKDRDEVWAPDYQKVDISSVISKETLTKKDYDLIFSQTGLTRTGFDSLKAEGDTDKVLEIQERFFSEPDCVKDQFAPFTCYHEIDSPIPTTVLEDGDIICSPTTHFSFFELGHSAIVTNAEYGTVLNSTGYETKSCFEDVTTSTNRPAFIILRAKQTKEKREKIAKYAADNLTDLPYSISIGIIGKKNPDKLTRTNCSHIIWYAFKKFGIEIDFNAGPFVFPRDIAKSDEFEVVQVFGIDPDKIKP